MHALDHLQRLQREAAGARVRAIEQAVAQDLSVVQTGRRLASARWLQRVAHHVWRVSAHLGGYDLRDEAAVELDSN